MNTALKTQDVTERVGFAARRLQDIQTLNDGNLAGADGSYRQQLVQEFFFHLIGAIDVLAQLVSEKRGLGFDTEAVTVTKVVRKLPAGDEVRELLTSLYVNTRGASLPSDPYSDEGYVFRAYNYRHQVTHRRRNPFAIRAGAQPPVSFFLDPRDRSLGAAARPAQDELQRMLDLIGRRCEDTLAKL